MLPNVFGLMFDGWSQSGDHFLAVYAISEQHDHILLAFSPLLDEERLDAESHSSFLAWLLGIYEKDWSNVGFIVADNCSTNKAIAESNNVPFIGCASHR